MKKVTVVIFAEIWTALLLELFLQALNMKENIYIFLFFWRNISCSLR